ncbi:hypothetical protein [Nocardiopsis alba]|uniref:hypothetical protein n=1 Tax=Nocardiopsis alba TaxID=53437 RepID=UPI003D7308F1
MDELQAEFSGGRCRPTGVLVGAETGPDRVEQSIGARQLQHPRVVAEGDRDAGAGTAPGRHLVPDLHIVRFPQGS